MSELTKLIKKTELLKHDLVSFQTKLSFIIEENQWKELPAVLAQVSDVCNNDVVLSIVPQSEKFFAKIGSVDPETGAKRYGTATEAKIANQNSIAMDLQTQYQALLTKLAELVKDHPVILVVNERVVDDRREDVKVVDEEELKRQHELALYELEVARKAAQIRERKLQETADQHFYSEQIEQLVKSQERLCNSLLSNKIHSESAVLQCIESICSHYQQCQQASTGRDLFKMAVTLLERIINRPDDAACRKLRITHPVLMAKLTGLHGGLELMLALGFHLTITGGLTAKETVLPDDQRLGAPHSSAVKALLVDRDRMTEPTLLRPLTGLFVLLAPHTAWDATLDMFEPALDSSGSSIGGKSEWITWFDSLSVFRDLLSKVAS